MNRCQLVKKKHYFKPTTHQHSVQNNLVEGFWMELLHFLIRHSQQPWLTKKSFWNTIEQGLRDEISFIFSDTTERFFLNYYYNHKK